MTQISFSAEFGFAPIGCEVVEFDFIKHGPGWKERYEYLAIPAEQIVVTSAWTTRDAADTLATIKSVSDIEVIRFTISDGNGSFIASAWTRASEAAIDIEKFLSKVGS